MNYRRAFVIQVWISAAILVLLGLLLWRQAQQRRELRELRQERTNSFFFGP